MGPPLERLDAEETDNEFQKSDSEDNIPVVEEIMADSLPPDEVDDVLAGNPPEAVADEEHENELTNAEKLK